MVLLFATFYCTGKKKIPSIFTKTNLCLMVTRFELGGTTSLPSGKKSSMIPSIIQDRKFSCFFQNKSISWPIGGKEEGIGGGDMLKNLFGVVSPFTVAAVASVTRS